MFKDSLFRKIITVITMLVIAFAEILSSGGEIFEEQDVPLSSGNVLISQGYRDINVIPDKYNTGAKGDLKAVGMAEIIDGIQFAAGNNGTANALDFAYRNKTISGEVVFKNYDFSEWPVVLFNEAKVDRSINIKFENCKFSKFTAGKSNALINFEFVNCTFENFNGSNSTFYNCMFTGSYIDGLNPFQNVMVQSCYFSDKTTDDPAGAGVHTDGTQLYGYSGLDLQNIHYDNCRFEIPAIDMGDNAAGVNACIMLQIEFSNAQGLSFTDCVLNGGGYSMYAWSKKGDYTLSDVLFKNIQIGSANTFGAIYPKVGEGVTFEDFSGTDALYVGSVWKSEGKTFLSVSNDTLIDRMLVVYTDSNEYSYLIPACPNVEEEKVFANYPFDVQVEIPEDCEYIVCYDASVNNETEQIRFVNWTDEDVYLTKARLDAVAEYSIYQTDDIMVSGSCGKNAYFTLNSAGVLTISGSGATDSYHSKKLVPWEDYKNYITTVVVEEGITSLGNQLFRKCIGLKNVFMAEGLDTIGGRVFDGCSFLETIEIPSTLLSIGEYSFSNVIVESIHYKGELEDWNAIEIGDNNAGLDTQIIFEKVVLAETSKKLSERVYSDDEIISRGMCGKECEYILLKTGELIIFGEGSTYDYHSAKLSPWYEDRESIEEVIIESGIERLGNQLFRMSNNIESVEVPGGVTEIGRNVFQGCKGLRKVSLPESLMSVDVYAFSGTAIDTVEYAGTSEQWSEISIGIRNTELVNAYEE